jgi:hypothetical protein
MYFSSMEFYIPSIQNNINIISEYSTPDMKTLMQFAKHSGKNYDMSLVSKISMELLKQI